MNLFVSLATPERVGEATALFHEVYEAEFKLNFDRFEKAFPLHFPSDVLLICTEGGQLVGTASMMKPLDGLFPSEYIFGARISQQAALFPIDRTVEIGRLAKRKDFSGGLIARTVMLATDAYLKAYGFEAWIATVRPPLHHILAKTGLEMIPFDLEPEKTDEQGACVNEYRRVKHYKGNSITVFRASAHSTAAAFAPVSYSLAEHSVQIIL